MCPVALNMAWKEGSGVAGALERYLWATVLGSAGRGKGRGARGRQEHR